MVPVLAVGALLTSIASAAPTDPPPALPSTAAWERTETDPRWVRGQVEVATAPDVVWSRLRNVEEWPVLLSDVRGLKMIRRGTERWRLNLDTWSMANCGPHDYEVQLAPDRSVSVDLDAPGAVANARFTIADGSAPGRAVLTYALMVDTKGVMGWFIPTKRLRRTQEEMVVRYLADFARAFGVPSVATATEAP